MTGHTLFGGKVHIYKRPNSSFWQCSSAAPRWVEGHKARLRLHLIPFFGSMGLSQITPGKVQEYRIHRLTSTG